MNRKEICLGFQMAINLIEEIERRAKDDSTRSAIISLKKIQHRLLKTAIAAAVPKGNSASMLKFLEAKVKPDQNEMLEIISQEILGQLEIFPVFGIESGELVKIITAALSEAKYNGNAEPYIDQVMDRLGSMLKFDPDLETLIYKETLIRETIALDAFGFGVGLANATSDTGSNALIELISGDSSKKTGSAIRAHSKGFPFEVAAMTTKRYNRLGRKHLTH